MNKTQLHLRGQPPPERVTLLLNILSRFIQRTLQHLAYNCQGGCMLQKGSEITGEYSVQCRHECQLNKNVHELARK